MTRSFDMSAGESAHAVVFPNTKSRGYALTDRRFPRTCQDHAVTLRGTQGAVLCVADGVSIILRENSNAQMGAVLAAELCAAAALDAVERGLGPSEIRELVLGEIESAFGPLARRFDALGQPARWRRTVQAALVLGVRTAGWSAVWCAGDGHWGALGGPDSRPRLLGSVGLAHDDGRWIATGGRKSRILQSAQIVPDLAAPHALPLVLEVAGDVHSLWVSTDGLTDEWETGRLLLSDPGVTSSQIAASTRREEGSDDLAIAASGQVLRHFDWHGRPDAPGRWIEGEVAP